MGKLRKVLLHVDVVCSIVCLIAKILDWYNPYMDFSGHIWILQMILYLSVIVLSVMEKNRRPKRTESQYEEACL